MRKSGNSVLSFGEFVTLMALMMSLVALSIDAILPALPDMGRDLRVTGANDGQLVVSLLFFGLAFLFTANGVEFQSTARGGNVFINSPYIITNFLVFLSLLSLFITPAFLASSSICLHLGTLGSK